MQRAASATPVMVGPGAGATFPVSVGGAAAGVVHPPIATEASTPAASTTRKRATPRPRQVIPGACQIALRKLRPVSSQAAIRAVGGLGSSDFENDPFWASPARHVRSCRERSDLPMIGRLTPAHLSL